MLLVCEKEALARELGRVVGVIERRTTIPILSHVHLYAGAKALMIRGTDLEMEIATPCEAQIQQQGVICVDGRTLHELVKRSADGPISLTLEDGGARLKVVAGRSRFTLPTLPAEDLPTLDGPATGKRSKGRSFIIEAAVLRTMLGATRWAMANDETRFYLNGVFLHQDGERLAAVATDGHRLGARFVALPAGADGMAGVILGRKLVGELLRALPDDGELAIEVDASRIAFTFAEVRIVSKLVDGQFPDYKRVIPVPQHYVTVNRKRLAEAVERVAVVLDAKGGRGVGLKLTAAAIEVQTDNPERGKAFDEIEAVNDGPQITIGVNHRYLGDILAAFADEQVKAGYTDHTGALLITDAESEDDSFRTVLMPMRFSEVQKEAA